MISLWHMSIGNENSSQDSIIRRAFIYKAFSAELSLYLRIRTCSFALYQEAWLCKTRHESHVYWCRFPYVTIWHVAPVQLFIQRAVPSSFLNFIEYCTSLVLFFPTIVLPILLLQIGTVKQNIFVTKWTNSKKGYKYLLVRRNEEIVETSRIDKL